MKEIEQLIKSAESIAVLAHLDEDCDAFASSLALVKVLKKLGKNVQYFVSKPIEERILFLGNDYKIYEDSDKAQFDLVICLDCGDITRLGRRKELFELAKKTLNIDHHYTNDNFADVNIVDADISSTGELLYNLLLDLGVEITKEIAELLYCAIMSDTGCLKYSCASPKTLICVSELMAKGIDHADLCRKLFDTEPLGLVKLKGHIMNDIESYFDGLVSVVTLDEKVLNEYGVSENEVGDVVNIPRSIKGTQIAIFFRKVGNRVKISFRSNGQYSVADISQKIGGGGHIMAAGASLMDVSIEDAKKRVLDIIKETIG